MELSINEALRQECLNNLENIESPASVVRLSSFKLVMVRTDCPQFRTYMDKSSGFPAGGIMEDVVLPSGSSVTIYLFEDFEDSRDGS